MAKYGMYLFLSLVSLFVDVEEPRRKVPRKEFAILLLILVLGGGTLAFYGSKAIANAYRASCLCPVPSNYSNGTIQCAEYVCAWNQYVNQSQNLCVYEKQVNATTEIQYLGKCP